MLSGDMVVEVLASVAVKGTVILALAAALSLAMRRAPASFRHLVWSLALGSVLLLPILGPLVPQWNVPGLPRIAPTGTRVVESGAVAATESRRIDRPRPARRLDVASASGIEARSREIDAPLFAERAVAEAPTGAGVPWGAVALFVWLAGALAVGAGIVLGVVRTWYLAGHALPVKSGRLWEAAERIAAQLGITRHVAVLQCQGSCMPMTWGLERPCVLLPAEADEWSDDLLQTVLLHELAHVRRYDYLTQLLARLACAIYWFNPLVWLAARRLRIERELACDDEVLRAGSRASDYAGHLLDMALSLRARPFLASVAMARASQLSARLRAVLDSGRARSSLTPRFVFAATACAALVAVTVAAASPSRVAEARETSERPGRSSVSEGRTLIPLAEIVDRPAPAARAARVARGRATSEVDGAASGVSESIPLPAGSVGRALYDPAPLARAALCDWSARSGSSSTSIQIDEDDMQVKMEVDDCELKVDLSGEITFNADETEIVALSPGGELEIEEKRGRSSRRLKIQADRSGNLERRWWVDRDERPYDADARAWLSDIILVLFRRVGIEAQERAERILARDGVDGLLQEIALIQSDHVVGRYYGVLLSQADLDPETVRRVMHQAAQDIESDHTLARLLVTVAENQPLDESVQIAYVNAAGSIESDYEQGRVLAAILQREDLSPEVTRAMLQAATEISSDHELARLLIGLVESGSLNDAMAEDFFRAVGTIESDFERRRVLAAALSSGMVSQRSLDMALQTAADIDSDHELARLLIDVADRYPAGGELPASYLAAAASIESDFELARVLARLVGRGDLSSASLAAVLELAAGIGSDHELSRFLQAVLSDNRLDEMTRPGFLTVAATIESDFELSRLLSAVVKADWAVESDIEAVLESALQINSDHELSRLLIEVARSGQLTERLRPSFMRATDTIESEFERGRVLSAAYPRSRQI
ncbi:MAG: M56 family metallopeptidase [Gemmatimonadota bacterium]|nr:MAG: M56 family metallopeptidase [Gemmatimonadota bacterium]